MLRNQKGFTYPLTLCFLVLLSTTLFIQIEQYLTEKKMLNETETILKQDYYLLSTVRKIESTLAAINGETVNAGSFDFYDGHADFQIKKITDTIWEINIQLMTGKKTVITGIAYYDSGSQKVIQWIERS
jgi:ComG operon protein 7